MYSNYFRNLVAGHIFGTDTASPLPQTFYLALSSTEPQADGTGVTEPGAAEYVRPSLVLGPPVDGTCANTQQAEFETGESTWGTFGWFALYDAAEGGHLIGGNSITNAPALVPGSSLVFRTNTLRFSVRDITSEAAG